MRGIFQNNCPLINNYIRSASCCRAMDFPMEELFVFETKKRRLIHRVDTMRFYENMHYLQKTSTPFINVLNFRHYVERVHRQKLTAEWGKVFAVQLPPTVPLKLIYKLVLINWRSFQSNGNIIILVSILSNHLIIFFNKNRRFGVCFSRLF